MKKILLYPFRIMDGLVDRIISLAGAVGLAQFPSFSPSTSSVWAVILKKRV